MSNMPSLTNAIAAREVDMDPHALPSLREWIDKIGTWDLRQFLVHNVNVGQALSMCAVFAPEFVLVDDCVFIEFLYQPDIYERWRRELGGENEAVERLINHLHLWDIFAPVSEGDYAALEYIALRIGEIWKMAAAFKFPDRRFVVDVTNSAEDYGPTIVLFSHRG